MDTNKMIKTFLPSIPIILLSFFSFSQNYTIKTDSVMTLAKQKKDISYTEFKPSEATIVIADNKCIVISKKAVKTYKINSHKLIKEKDVVMVFNCTYRREDYILKLIVQSDKKKIFTVTDGIKTDVYNLSSLSKE